MIIIVFENSRISDNNKIKDIKIPMVLSNKFILKIIQGNKKEYFFFNYFSKLIEIFTLGDISENIYFKQYLYYIENIKTLIQNENVSKENKIEEIKIDNKLNYFRFLNFSLYLLALDLLFLFMITFPICSMIELYKSNSGFTYVFQIILIAYQCDNGALLLGKLFGKKKFGYPITPTKTYEGIFGAFFLGYKSLFL